MNLKTLALFTALSGGSVAAFASADVGLNVETRNVRHDHGQYSERGYGGRLFRSAPPPLRREYRGHRPHRHAVWVNGYWTHHRGRHVWVPGHWTRIPRGRHAWVQPRWERRPGGYIYIEGFWR
ncbi:MAG TPA: hypothetical protein VL069_03000 [Opitutus sp.]|nr:hypothetical protein [Opitutus sp.]